MDNLYGLHSKAMTHEIVRNIVETLICHTFISKLADDITIKIRLMF